MGWLVVSHWDRVNSIVYFPCPQSSAWETLHMVGRHLWHNVGLSWWPAEVHSFDPPRLISTLMATGIRTACPVEPLLDRHFVANFIAPAEFPVACCYSCFQPVAVPRLENPSFLSGSFYCSGWRSFLGCPQTPHFLLHGGRSPWQLDLLFRRLHLK